MDQRRFGGTPAGLDQALTQRWEAIVEVEMERLLHGQSLLDPYGAKDPTEFFAVSVEFFFERPQAMRRHHGELYQVLSSYFQQDPAAWDDVRGLTL